MAELTGFRDRIKVLSPAFLQEGVGERLMFVFGLELDAVMERLVQGVGARFPVITNLTTGEKTPALPDALAVIGTDRLIDRGLTETDLSYGIRLRRAFDSWRLAGSARAELGQVLGYLLQLVPMVRSVSSRYEADPARVAWRIQHGLSGGPSSYPPALLSSTWDTYLDGADPTAEPDHVFALAGANGEWDWDSLSQVTGSWGWWGCFVILYSVAPDAWTEPDGKWGDPGKWGDGGAWGVTASANVGRSIRAIICAWKPAHVWVRYIIAAFDDSLFSPAAPAGGGINPDGRFGRWSKIVNGQYVRSRFTGARYASGIV